MIFHVTGKVNWPKDVTADQVTSQNKLNLLSRAISAESAQFQTRLIPDHTMRINIIPEASNEF